MALFSLPAHTTEAVGIVSPLFPRKSGSVACAAGTGVVDISELEDDDTVGTLTSCVQDHPHPRSEDNAQSASLTNKLTTLALAGVPVMKTSREDVIRNLHRVVEVTTREHAEV